MLRQARIAELEAELAHLKCEISDNSITNIKKLYYNTYGERHYDIIGWNTVGCRFIVHPYATARVHYSHPFGVYE